MTTILNQYMTLVRVAKDGLHEEWVARDQSPGYDETGLTRAIRLSGSIANEESVKTILDYESQVATQLQHKYIARTIAAAREGADFWFVQKLEASETLRVFFDELRNRGYETLTIPLALSVASATAQGVHAAHSAKNAAGWSLNAVHGGLDFHTVRIAYDGGIRVSDFGVAKALRRAQVARLVDMTPGRLGYFSPEECRGRNADAKSDVFSIGAILWELLTGESAFGQYQDVFQAICETNLQPPSSFNAKVTSGLDSLVMRALTKDPKLRYENCEHLNIEILKLVPDPAKALERVPRIMTQLFEERSEDWQRLQENARQGDMGGTSTFALKLFQVGDAARVSQVEDEETLNGVRNDLLRQERQHAMDDAVTQRVDGDNAAGFASDVDNALGFLDNSPHGGDWESAPVGAAADKLANMWDEPGDDDRTITRNAPTPTKNTEDTVPQALHSNFADTIVQGDSPPASEWGENLEATLPAGVSADQGDFDTAPQVESPVGTHMAYKPTPMPDDGRASASDRDARREEEPIHYEEQPREELQPRKAQHPDSVEAQPDAPIPEPSADREPARPAPQMGGWDELPPFEDDEDDEPFFEPFSIDEIVEPPELSPKGQQTSPVLEIIRTANGRALDIDVFRSALHGYRKPGSGVRARKVGKKATLKFKEPVQGWVRRVKQPKEDIDPNEKLVLEPGDAAKFVENGVEYHVRLFRPPVAPARQRQLITPQQIKLYGVAFALSLVFHGLGMLGALLTSYLGVDLTVKTKPKEAEIFAEGTLKKEKPKKKEEPKPKPKPKKLEPKPPADPTEQQAKIPKAVRKQLDKRLRRKPAESEEESTDRLLNTLTTPKLGDGETIKDVVTNIDAVAKPGSRGAAFKVTGTLGKLPEGGVNIATSAGGNKIGDIGGSVKSDVGKLDKRKKSGKVRGQARGVKALSRVKGTLSRGQVWEVIQKHSGQIQRCYERELTKNPGLAGKIQFMWTVKTNGRVGSVRERSNSMGNPAVSKCISGVIKKMKFPRPKGGEVEIVFPWIFKAL